MQKVRRGFVEIAEGDVHYRTAGTAAPGRRPLILIHAMPGSSRGLAPLMEAMSDARQQFAFDMLGAGHSAAPAVPEPDIAYLAQGVVKAVDALGIVDFDLYGAHTGASVAMEIAISRPDHVHRLILNGVTLFDEAERADKLAHYAPPIVPDDYGRHLVWAWNFVRDMTQFYPWYEREPSRRINRPVPPADQLHDLVMEVLTAARTYHLCYNAAFAYDSRPRLPLVRVKTLLACPDTDPLSVNNQEVANLLPASRMGLIPSAPTAEARAETARLFNAFLDAADE